jgi:hypothetical protein
VEASSVTCPKCQHSFPLSAAIERPIVEKLQQQLEQKLIEERRRIAAEQAKKAQEAVGLHLADLEAQLSEKNKKLEATEKEQLALLRQKRELDEQKRAFEVDKARQIEAEREKIRQDAKKAALDEGSKALGEMQQALAAKEKRLLESQESERKLRQEMLDFEERKKALDLEIARKTEAARLELGKKKDEEFQLKEADFAKKEADWKRQVEEMKRKLEQGSQQAQGEVLELHLETQLRNCFSEDEIAEVAKGTYGGDIHQQVRSEMGQDCGMILWECKRTKSWSEVWVDKIKQDMLEARAQIGVIVTSALPKGIANFECREGVWITTPSLAMPLAMALRSTLIEVAAARRSIEGMREKTELVYQYISGTEFKARVLAIVEGFRGLQEELEAEKRVTMKNWARREKQLERVIANTAGMYGDLSGIIGKAMPEIEQLEAPLLADQPLDDPHFRRRSITSDKL